MRVTPREISQKLSAQTERFCRYLFPAGKIVNGEFCVGSVGGEAGRSCKIRIAGEKAGIWCDFSSDNDRGDLLDLLSSVRGKGLGAAVKEAKEWLGLREPESLVRPKAYRKPPKKPAGVKSLVEQDPVWTYLTKERELKPETIKAFRVATCGREMVFPSYSPDGELENLKYIGIDRSPEGKKSIRDEGGCAPALFGWQSIPAEVREIVITEGQLDAMSWFQMGFPALSVPSGVNSIDNFIEYEWENLDRFDTIYLNFDSDAPGQKAVIEAAKKLGKSRCLSITFRNYKDANEALQAGASNEEFAAAVVSAKPFSPQQIKSPKDFRDEVVDFFHPVGGVKPGFHPPLFNYNIGFRPGELTVWTGVSGHGKSVLLSLILLYAAHQGQRAAFASMEMTGTQTLSRMVCQITRYHTPPKEVINECIDWMAGRIWIYDVMGNVDTNLLLDLMDYSRARHSVDHFVIDSLMKCNVGSEDYDGQRIFVDRLHTFAKQSGAHVHLVAHARKGKDEHAVVGKLDIKGASDIGNQADNCLTVWRNKAKEEETRKSGRDSDSGQPDTIVYCDKQRTTGWEGEVPLWYFRKCFLFVGLERGSVTMLPLGPKGATYNHITKEFE